MQSTEVIVDKIKNPLDLVEDNLESEPIDIYWSKSSHTTLNLKDWYSYQNMRVNVVGSYTRNGKVVELEQPIERTGYVKVGT